MNFTQQRCSPATTVPSFVNEVHQSLHKAYSSARSHISSAHRQNKDYYDRQKPFVPFQVGDQVWLFTPVVRCGKTKKFTSQWRGPYTVLDRVSKVNYRIKLVGSAAQPKVVHHNRLKLCYGTPQQIVAPNQQLPSNTETRPLYSDIVQRPVHSAAGGYTTSSDRQTVNPGNNSTVPVISPSTSSGAAPTSTVTSSSRPQRERRAPCRYDDFVAP